jgi:hypothetical protein
MLAPGFDPHRDLLLETPPQPAPVSASAPLAGAIHVPAETTDAITLELDTPRPAILLMSDPYTPSWRAVALPGSVQSHYTLQPADYILRAIPLQAGHHHLRIEYAPRAFTLGAWLSALAWLIYAAAGITLLRRRRPA